MEQSVILGRDSKTNELVRLPAEALQQHVHILGTTGVGKTDLLLNIALALINRGDGLSFLDPHGTAVDRLLAMIPKDRENDVILWDVPDIERPFGLDLFRCKDLNDAAEIDRVAATFIETFKRIFPEAFASGPRMEELMRNMALTFIENPGFTLAETTLFLRDQDYRSQFLAKVHNPYIRDEYWPFFDIRTFQEQNEIISSSLNKLGRFLANTLVRNIVGQSTSSLDTVDIMNQRRILLMRLPVGLLGDENAELLGSIFVGNILDAAMVRGTERHLPQFHLVVDEYQRFVSSAFPTLLEEARKFHVDVIIANQRLSQLERGEDKQARDAALAVANKIIFRVNPLDADLLAKEFDTTPPEAEKQLQIVTQPIYDTRIEIIWTPTEAQAEYEKLSVEFKKICIEAALLLTSIGGWDHKEYWESLDTLLEVLVHGDDLAQLEIHKAFNPTSLDDDVRRFAEKKIIGGRPLKTGNSFQARTRGRQKVIFLADMPSRAEYRLKKLLAIHPVTWDVVSDSTWFYCALQRLTPKEDWPSDVKSNWAWAGRGEVIPLVNALLAEIQSVLSPLKERAGHYWINAPTNEGEWLGISQGSDWTEEKYSKTGFVLETKFFPETFRWLRRKILAIKEPYDKLKARRMELWTHRHVVQKRRYLYDLPVKEGYPETQRYERVPGTQRLRGDVAAEIANKLVRLSNYHAQCKLIQDGRPKEYAISTIPAPEVDPEGEERRNRIREHSRLIYGRDRREVEKAIEERLQIVSSRDQAFATLETDEQPTDDEPITFGEKKTASHS